MTLPAPFGYSKEAQRRRHGPRGYKSYQSYKPWLRDEFTFRCAYCLERETWHPNRAASFSADHFEPKILNPERERDYANLVYSCARCNSVKSVQFILLDPTVAALGDHLFVGEDGSIEALSVEGQQMIDLLHLDKNPAIEVRKECFLILRAKREQPDNPTIHELFVRRFGYPDDLPDLTSLRPPEGNAQPGSEKSCYHARRIRGELDLVY